MDSLQYKWKPFKRSEYTCIEGEYSGKWISWYYNGNLLKKQMAIILILTEHRSRLENGFVGTIIKIKNQRVNILTADQLENGFFEMKMVKKLKSHYWNTFIKNKYNTILFNNHTFDDLIFDGLIFDGLIFDDLDLT